VLCESDLLVMHRQPLHQAMWRGEVAAGVSVRVCRVTYATVWHCQKVNTAYEMSFQTTTRSERVFSVNI
jgi:hypothetical protein